MIISSWKQAVSTVPAYFTVVSFEGTVGFQVLTGDNQELVITLISPSIAMIGFSLERTLIRVIISIIACFVARSGLKP
jgi:hypothetical protein